MAKSNGMNWLTHTTAAQKHKSTKWLTVCVWGKNVQKEKKNAFKLLFVMFFFKGSFVLSFVRSYAFFNVCVNTLLPIVLNSGTSYACLCWNWHRSNSAHTHSTQFYLINLLEFISCSEQCAFLCSEYGKHAAVTHCLWWILGSFLCQ